MLVMEGVLHILTHGRTSNRVKYPALHWVTLSSAFYPLPILFRQCHKHYPFMDNQLKYRLLAFTDTHMVKMLLEIYLSLLPQPLVLSLKMNSRYDQLKLRTERQGSPRIFECLVIMAKALGST